MIRAVIFDMDGLLLDTEQVYFQGYRNTRIKMGLQPDDTLFYSLIGLNAQSGIAALAEAMGAAEAQAFDSAWAAENKRLLADTIPVKPGVQELCAALQKAELPYAIATSTRTDRALEHLARAGLAPLFDQVTGGDQVENGKPAPDIYLKSAERLGVPPEACAAFEDSENGVRAALAAGMTTVQVPDIKHPSEAFRALGHHVAPDLLTGAKIIGLPL